ncbi:hypothetical protein Hanom_Chr16g01496891 [Helianthus anomalus]
MSGSGQHRGFQFPPKWDARYPQQGQTVADAPPGSITLFADFFLDGNFQLSATTFMASILNFYGFHISQMSPMGMVRVRHFKFLCRSQGLEPSESDKIEKEELPIPKMADWYMHLFATPNRSFGEQVLVVAGMSDKWLEHSEEVYVLMFHGEVAQLYQDAFPTFSGAIGVRPLEAGEVYWYKQIKAHFLHPPAGAFANPPTVTEETKEGPGEAKKKVTVDTGATSKKAGGSRAILEKGTLRFRQSNLEDYVVASDSLEGYSRICERKKGSAAASKSSGSAGSRAPESG